MTPTPEHLADIIVCDIINCGGNISMADAKKAAIVVIDYIIKSEPMKPRDYTDTIGYYEAVKREIENI